MPPAVLTGSKMVRERTSIRIRQKHQHTNPETHQRCRDLLHESTRHTSDKRAQTAVEPSLESFVKSLTQTKS